LIRHTHAVSAAIEDLQAVVLDAQIELSRSRIYRARLLAGLPEEIRPAVAQALAEEAETDRYIEDRLTAAMDILSSARPGPNAYNPNRPAVRAARPMMLEASFA
jgi:hypothetical protein